MALRMGRCWRIHLALWMLISVIHSPDAGPRAEIENAADVGVFVVWWRESKFPIESEIEDVVLEIFVHLINQSIP
jgi:hypothetical protein